MMKRFTLFLLQSLNEFQIQPKPIHAVVFLVGVGLFVALIIFLNTSKKVRNSAVFKSGVVKTPQVDPKGVKELAFAVRKFGLEAGEQKFLAEVFQEAQITAADTFETKDTIDEGFEKALSFLNREEDSQNAVAKLFSIRNKIEYYLQAEGEATQAHGKPVGPRRYKRLETSLPATFYHVRETIEKHGAKKVKKMHVDKAAMTGTILDISAGGCAISTGASAGVGARIKIEFNIHQHSSAVLAQIIRANKNQSGTVLHTRFLAVPVQSLNAINRFVYDYKDM